MDGDSMDVDGPSYIVLNEDTPMPQAAPQYNPKSLLNKKRAYDEFAQGHRERAPLFVPICPSKAKYFNPRLMTSTRGLSPAFPRNKIKLRTGNYDRGSIPPLFRGCPQPSPYHNAPRILHQSPKQLRELSENVARINHPVRRIGGMVTTVCTIGISIIASAWNYFTGAEPTNIIAVETDSTGSKRRAIEVERPTAQDITPKVPGSYIQSPQDSYPKSAGQSAAATTQLPSAPSFRRISDLALAEKEDTSMDVQPINIPKIKHSATHQAHAMQKYKKLNEPMFSPSAQPKQTGAAWQSAMQSASQSASQPTSQPASQPASQPTSQPSVQLQQTGAASQAAAQPATKSASYFPLRWPLKWQSNKPAASSSDSAQPLQSGAASKTEMTSPKSVQPLQNGAASATAPTTPQKAVQPLQSGAGRSAFWRRISPMLRDEVKEALREEYDWKPKNGYVPRPVLKRDLHPWYVNFTGDIPPMPGLPNGKTVAEQKAEREAREEKSREYAWLQEIEAESSRWAAEEWQRRQEEDAEKSAKEAAERAWQREQREAQEEARFAALEKKKKDAEDYEIARALLPLDQRPNSHLPKPRNMLIRAWEEDFEFLATPPPFKPDAWEAAKKAALTWGVNTYLQMQVSRDAETDAQRDARKAEGRTKYHDLEPEDFAEVWLARHHNETWEYYMAKDTRARERAKAIQKRLQKEANAQAKKDQEEAIARIKAEKARLAAEQAKAEEERLRIEAEEKAAKQLKREQKKAEKAEKARLEQVRLEQEAEQARLEEEAKQARIQAEREAEQAKLKAAEEAEEARLAKELEDKAKVAEAKPVDPEWLKKQQLVRPLDPEWAEKIDQAMAAKSKEAIVATTVDGTEISRHDLESLIRKPGVKNHPWLNDEIVNGIMAAIVGRKLEQTGWAKGSKTAPAYAYMPSMWFNNYQKPGGINNIANWTRRRGIKGVKLLEAEKVFFPVNTGAHWMLLIVSPKARTLEFLDSFNFGRGSKAAYFKIAREWLAMELESKYVAEEWTELPSESSPQSNSDDCGAFTCFNALAAGKGVGFDAVGGGQMADARRMLAAVLVNGGFKGDFEL